LDQSPLRGENIIAGTTSVPGFGRRGSIRPGSDEVDFEIKGREMQFVEVELDPGESTIAEAGSMMFKDAPLHMYTVFGDGSRATKGFGSKFWSAGKRLLTGESLFMTVFSPNRARARPAWPLLAPIPAESWHSISVKWVAS
jgi:hypothetical protein